MRLKNFTWKRFFSLTLWFFVVTLIVQVLWNAIGKKNVSNNFTTSELIIRGITAIVVGFCASLLNWKSR